MKSLSIEQFASPISLSALYSSYKSIDSSIKGESSSPFISMVIDNNLKKIQTFLSSNSNQNLEIFKDSNDQNVLHISAANNSFYLFQRFLLYQKQFLRNNVGLEYDEITVKIAKWVNEQDKIGCTSAHYAALLGNINIIQSFVNCGGLIQIPNFKGMTVIHCAVQKNQPIMLCYLKEVQDLSIHLKDNNGSTVLHQAAFFGSEICLNILLSWNMNPNQQDNEGFTSLHLAVIEENEKIIKKLLSRGANISIKDNLGRNCIQIAEELSKMNLVNLLENNELDLCRFCIRMSKKQRQRSVQYLIFLVFLFVITIWITFIAIYPYFEIVEITYCNIVLQFITWIFFLISWLIDPGYLPQLNRISMYNLQLCYESKDICFDCQLVRPQRSKHCEICQRCVIVYDHHCPWINNCIGARNQKYFLVFILFYFFVFFMCISQSLYLLIFYPSLNQEYKQNLIILQFLRIFLILTGIIPLILLSILIKSQIKSFFQNLTTFEQLQNKSASNSLKNCNQMCFKNIKKYNLNGEQMLNFQY